MPPDPVLLEPLMEPSVVAAPVPLVAVRVPLAVVLVLEVVLGSSSAFGFWLVDPHPVSAPAPVPNPKSKPRLARLHANRRFLAATAVLVLLVEVADVGRRVACHFTRVDADALGNGEQDAD